MLKLNVDFYQLSLNNVRTISVLDWSHEHALRNFNKQVDEAIEEDFVPITTVAIQCVGEDNNPRYMITQQFAKG